MFERIENKIRESITRLTLPPEFKFEFKIMPPTLQFNMIDDKDIELILEGLDTIIHNIQDLVEQTNKTQYEESIFFPFEKHTDRTRALLIIKIQYNLSTDHTGNQVTVRHG